MEMEEKTGGGQEAMISIVRDMLATVLLAGSILLVIRIIQLERRVQKLEESRQ